MRTFPKNIDLNIDFCNILIGKFEIGRGLFENFGKLEDGFSKFSNIPIFGRYQMNEPLEAIKYHFDARNGKFRTILGRIQS